MKTLTEIDMETIANMKSTISAQAATIERLKEALKDVKFAQDADLLSKKHRVWERISALLAELETK